MSCGPINSRSIRALISTDCDVLSGCHVHNHAFISLFPRVDNIGMRLTLDTLVRCGQKFTGLIKYVYRVMIIGLNQKLVREVGPRLQY